MKWEGVTRVRRSADGTIADLVAIEGDWVRVRLPDGQEVEWHAQTVRPAMRTRPPRGLIRPTARMLEASVLYAMPRDQGGLTPKELAAKYGVSAHTIHNWIEKVRDATIEARARAPQLAAE